MPIDYLKRILTDLGGSPVLATAGVPDQDVSISG